MTSPPALVIRIPLEEHGTIVVLAETHEDEARLRSWLRRSPVWRELPALLERLLNDLDEADQERAA